MVLPSYPVPIVIVSVYHAFVANPAAPSAREQTMLSTATAEATDLLILRVWNRGGRCHRDNRIMHTVYRAGVSRNFSTL